MRLSAKLFVTWALDMASDYATRDRIQSHSYACLLIFLTGSVAVAMTSLTSVTQENTNSKGLASGFQTGVRGPKGVRDGFPRGPREDSEK